MGKMIHFEQQQKYIRRSETKKYVNSKKRKLENRLRHFTLQEFSCW